MKALEQLDEFLKKFDEKRPEGVVVKGRRVFLVSKELEAATKDVKLDFFSIGLPLGESTPRGFRPSLALLDMLKSSSNTVIVTDESAYMFTCERDIFEENVIADHSSKELFLVQTENSEIIGLGSWFSKGGKKFIKPELDRGDFLRRERTRKKK